MCWKILEAVSLWSRTGLLFIILKKITYSVQLWRWCWKFTARLNGCINAAMSLQVSPNENWKGELPLLWNATAEVPSAARLWIPACREQEDDVFEKCFIFGAYCLKGKIVLKFFISGLGHQCLHWWCPDHERKKLLEGIQLLEMIVKRQIGFWSNLGEQEGVDC